MQHKGRGQARRKGQWIRGQSRYLVHLSRNSLLPCSGSTVEACPLAMSHGPQRRECERRFDKTNWRGCTEALGEALNLGLCLIIVVCLGKFCHFHKFLKTRIKREPVMLMATSKCADCRKVYFGLRHKSLSQARVS